MKKVKQFLSENRKLLVFPTAVSALTSIFCFAAGAVEGDAMSGITSSLTTGFTDIAGDILTVLGIAVVAVLGVVGVKIAVKAAIKFFSSMAK